MQQNDWRYFLIESLICLNFDVPKFLVPSIKCLLNEGNFLGNYTVTLHV